MVLVFEVQAETVGRDGRPRREACGWGLVRPFGYEASDMPDSSRGIQPATQRSEFIIKKKAKKQLSDFRQYF